MKALANVSIGLLFGLIIGALVANAKSEPERCVDTSPGLVDSEYEESCGHPMHRLHMEEGRVVCRCEFPRQRWER